MADAGDNRRGNSSASPGSSNIQSPAAAAAATKTTAAGRVVATGTVCPAMKKQKKNQQQKKEHDGEAEGEKGKQEVVVSRQGGSLSPASTTLARGSGGGTGGGRGTGGGSGGGGRGTGGGGEVGGPKVPSVALSGPGRVRLPVVGFGTGTAWFQSNDSALERAIVAALDAGFRSLDSAEMYGNEAAEKRALARWFEQNKGVSREDLCITSKALESIDSEGGVIAGCKRSLANMGLSYFDLYLLHAPFRRSGEPFSRPLSEIWADMESLVEQGLCRAIGVSNFRVPDLQEILRSAKIKPAVNQVEHHPYLQQPELHGFCRHHGIFLQAYAPLTPLTDSNAKDGPVVKPVTTIAARLGCAPEAVLIRWAIQGGKILVTTSGNAKRLPILLSAASQIELNPDEMISIDRAGQQRPCRRFWTQCPQFHADPRKEECHSQLFTQHQSGTGSSLVDEH